MATYKDRIGEIPEDWEAVNGYHYLLLESGMRPAEHVTDNPNDIPSLGGENITGDGFLTFKNLRYISRDYYARMPKGKLIDGDILINKDGANTGKLAFAKTNPFPETSVNEHVFLIRNKGDFEQDFLFYFLLSALGQNQIQPKVVGSAQPGINNSFTKGLYIPKPPKPEQRTIASMISKVDEAIAATKNSIAKAERLKKSLMQNLLTGKLKPDGTWRKENEFQEIKMGFFPKEWEIKTVSQISSKVTDGEHTTPARVEKGNYLLSARNIKNGYLDLSDVDYVNDDELKKIQKRCKPEKGDLFISCSGTLGNVCIVPEGLNCGLVRSVALVKIRQEIIEPEFVEILFQTPFMFKKMMISVSSSVQGNLFQSAIKKLKFPYPSEEERLFIIEKFKGVNQTIKSKKAKIKKLERLKKALMQNLLTGKVRVKIKETVNG